MPPEVLLVEDEEASAEALAYWLGLHGFHVVRATNGREALAQMETSIPAVVLCDIMMPVMDGLELIREMRRRPELASVPIALMSAAHGMLHHETGIAAVLPKPLDLKRLVEVLKRLTDGPAPG